VKRPLRPREVQILQALADQRSTRDIAGDLHLSYYTVKEHICNAMRVTGLHTRAHLVAEGLREGWIV
jgi:DNA-binding NarL/FixJ family response regulator